MYVSTGLGAVAPVGGARSGRGPLVIRVPRIRRRGMGYLPGDPVLCYDTSNGRIVPCGTPGSAPVPAQTPGYAANAPYGSPLWLAEESTYVNSWVPCAGNPDCPPSGWAPNPSYPGQTSPGGVPTLTAMPADGMAAAIAAGYKVGNYANPAPSPVPVPVVYTPPVAAPPSQSSAALPVVYTPPVSSSPGVREISVTPAANPSPALGTQAAVSSAGPVPVDMAAANPLSDFLSATFGIGSFQIPVWLIGLGVVGGAWALSSSGKRGH